MTPLELENYEGSIMAMLDERGRIDGAFEKGEKKGMEEGREEGGQNKAREIARSMRHKNLENTLIAELTGLAVEEIEKLE